VEIINIEKAVISGNPLQIVGVYKKRRTMTNHGNPEEAAKWPRRPDFLFKKVLKGMLPNSSRGKEAARRVKAYLGETGKKATKHDLKDSSKLRRNFITIEQLSKELGWTLNG